MTSNEALKLAVQMHKEFNSHESEFSLEFELNEEMWCREGMDNDSVSYNTDGNKEDLFQGEGQTYNLEIRYVTYEDEDFYKVYADNGCGDKYHVVFLKKNEVQENEFE
jgi:hypothetical protein